MWKGQALLPFYGICIKFLGALRPCAMLQEKKIVILTKNLWEKNYLFYFKCCSNLFDISTHPKVTAPPCTELASGGDLGMGAACPSV